MRAWCLLLFVLAVGCEACGSQPHGAPPAPRPPQRPEPGPTVEAAPVEPAGAASVDPIVRVVDPNGHAQVVAREVRGDHAYLLVLHDLYADARAEIEALPNADAVEETWMELSAACPGEMIDVLRCIAPYAPHVASMTDLSDERAHGWSVAVVAAGRVVAQRSLVALSVHDPREPATPAAMRVEDVDGDGRVEVIVDLPFAPLRDDAPFRWGEDENGAVTYVLDASLAVQARWTSMWLWGERQDDGDSPPRESSCSVVEEFGADRSLALTQTCDGRERGVRCPYDAARDRYDCPAGFADELLEPWSRHTRHYAGETLDDLRRQLPGLGTEVAELHRRAAARPPDP